MSILYKEGTTLFLHSLIHTEREYGLDPSGYMKDMKNKFHKISHNLYENNNAVHLHSNDAKRRFTFSIKDFSEISPKEIKQKKSTIFSFDEKEL
jgi:hypothetical protein